MTIDVRGLYRDVPNLRNDLMEIRARLNMRHLCSDILPCLDLKYALGSPERRWASLDADVLTVRLINGLVPVVPGTPMPPTGAAGGHLEGTYPNPSVRGMTIKQDIAVDTPDLRNIGTAAVGLLAVYSRRFITPTTPVTLL